MDLQKIFHDKIEINGNLILRKTSSDFINQEQTNASFSEKWKRFSDKNSVEQINDFQLDWYLRLYGFSTEKEFQNYLKTKNVILDAGCGVGFKPAWIAGLAPHAIVIGIDFSASVFKAAEKYKDISNLFFVRGDIADTGIQPGKVDYISCDQVIHHTENPPITFRHLVSLLKNEGEFSCYVYSKKALPRELLDDYFRQATHGYTNEQIWDLSEQLTELGKNLSDLSVKFKCPAIPLLGIKEGEYDIQRFLYWNFIKCFWNAELGHEVSVVTNFDWYSPSNAYRYSEQEFKAWVYESHLKILHFHIEEACYAGRFKK